MRGLPPDLRSWPGRRVVWALVASTLLTGAVVLLLDRPLARVVPGGIVTLELAWDPTSASEIVAAWSEAGRLATARAALGSDFAFLISYGLLLTGLGLRLARSLERSPRAWLVSVGPPLARAGAWAGAAAAGLDAVENLALSWVLATPEVGVAVRVAALAAGAKFALAGGSAAVVGLGAVVALQVRFPLLQYLWLSRFPLVAALGLTALGPVAAGPARALLRNLFDLEPAELAVVGGLAFVAAWTVTLTALPD